MNYEVEVITTNPIYSGRIMPPTREELRRAKWDEIQFQVTQVVIFMAVIVSASLVVHGII